MIPIRAALVLALLSSQAAAQDWQRLTGDEVTTALTARVLAYDGGQTQNFLADGRTLYSHVRLFSARGAVNAVPETDTLNRVRNAVYLVALAPNYQVEQ